MARRKWLAVLLVSIAPLAIRAALLPWMPAPTPRIHDEFSYLLAGDTFAHGRAANPQHPLWVHFETMHVLSRPAYASIFPVAQGLILAAGQKIAGNPWFGVCFSVAAMCGALCWMLQGWVSAGWALAGGLLAAARFGVFSYWMNSYYGGATAAIGGALVLGAVGRMLRRSRWIDGAVLGLGLAILANSRPFEGLLFVVCGAAFLGSRRLLAGVAMVPVLIPALAGLVWYCYRITGSPIKLPYSLYRESTMAPHFIWQAPRPEPLYYHRVTRSFYTGWEMAAYRDARANRSPYGVVDKARTYARFYIGPAWGLAIAGTLPWLVRRRRTRALLLTGTVFSAGLLLEVWHAPHYAAPALGLMLLVTVESLRHLRLWRWGRIAVWMVAALCVATPVRSQPGDAGGRGGARAKISANLTRAGGAHLAIVRYSLTHDSGDEWVYNAADIDSAPVVWAREMDPTSNRELLAYFPNRRAWLVEPDAQPPRASPYDPAAPQDPPFAFVRLGAAEIAVLRDPAVLAQRVRDWQARNAAAEFMSCDQWNSIFHEITGIQSPEPANGCFPPGSRGATIDFEHWWQWLAAQR